MRADAAAWSLRLAMDQIVVMLAAAANAFRREQGWTAFGYARMDDHARERFGRTGRWLRDMAALGEALERLPGLADAMTGADGGRPIGRVAALMVGKVATSDSLAAWVALARSLTVRRLRQEALAARSAGAEWPIAAQDSEGADPEEDDDPEIRDYLRFLVPLPIKAAFEEVLDLFRAVEGSEVTMISFIEALLAEASSDPWPTDAGVEADRRPLARSEWLAIIEEALARATDLWGHLARPGTAGSPTPAGDAAQTPCARDARALDETTRALITIEDSLERQLARLLREMAESSAWSRLRFSGADHYAEQRLGLSRCTIRRRLQVARALARLPVIRQAYASGEIGLEAARHLTWLAQGLTIDLPTQHAWVARAREATVKRLRDEARAFARAGRLAASGREPLSDAAWHASLRREPGRTREFVAAMGREAALKPMGDVFLRLRLPPELATRLQGAIAAARTRAGAHLPLWAGLLALLADFARVWDDPAGMPRRNGDDVFIRDGWRCMAPGCSSRRNLEGHHVRYRSRGGGDNPDNLVCLCRFHHQRGEHGGLASCQGSAPLGLVWRLGRQDLGVAYRNERT